MKYQNIKFYPLPNKRFIVSYYDLGRNKRFLKEFINHDEAQIYLTKLRNKNIILKNTDRLLQRMKIMNIEELAHIFIKKVPNCSLLKQRLRLKLFIEDFGLFKPEQLTTELIHCFLVKLKQEHNYSNKVLIDFKSALKTFFGFLVKSEIQVNINLDSLKIERGVYVKPHIVLTPDQFSHLIKISKINSPSLFYPIFLLIYETASKTEDILNLKWQDINFKNKTLIFPRSKNIQNRDFEISDELINAFKSVNKIHDYVFTNLRSQPLNKISLGKELKRFKANLGLGYNFALRDLRITYAAHFLMRKGSFNELQKIMGHTSIHTTIEAYGRYKAV